MILAEGILYKILENTAGIERRWIYIKMTKSNMKQEVSGNKKVENGEREISRIIYQRILEEEKL